MRASLLHTTGCFVGKRRLDAAIKAFCDERPGKFNFLVKWRPFFLDPTLPKYGRQFTSSIHVCATRSLLRRLED
jgi:predicted DsbA family dithiol-disulfide isomerase